MLSVASIVIPLFGLAFPFVVSSLLLLFDARRGLLTPPAACFAPVFFGLNCDDVCRVLQKIFTIN